MVSIVSVCVQEVQDEFFSIEEGLDLVVSKNPKTLRHVAILLLAANRMRRGLSCCSRGLKGEELCSAIMDSLVTGREQQYLHNETLSLVK